MAAKGAQPLFRTIIDSLPIRPVNCTTFVATKAIAGERSHPLHIKTKRRLERFDPQGFYWRFNCPVEISKKAIVRNQCKKEFKKAFVWALAEAGWGADGFPLDPNRKQGRLTGAVLLPIVKDPALVLTAKEADLRREAGDAVKKILSKYAQPASLNLHTVRTVKARVRYEENRMDTKSQPGRLARTEKHVRFAKGPRGDTTEATTKSSSTKTRSTGSGS